MTRNTSTPALIWTIAALGAASSALVGAWWALPLCAAVAFTTTRWHRHLAEGEAS